MALTKVTTGGIKDGTITNEDISATTSISQDKLAATPGASSIASGLMIPADKNKLDGVADNANNYSHPSAHTVSEVTGLQGLLDGKTTETYVNTQITNVIGAAPAALDTLTELAAALGDDANYAATVTTALAGKVDDSQVLTNVPSGALFTDTNTTYSVGDGGLTQKNFTTADNTKLDGIEAGANVTDTTNVTAAGALMDSEVTNLTQVKAFDSTDYATAAQGATANAALPKAGGTMTGDVSLGDNVKATFGAGDDLQIYHDGSKSIISDNGSGNLYIYSDQFIINNYPDTQNMARFVSGGAATLYHAGSAKLATTSTGIDVTGKINADAMPIGSVIQTVHTMVTTNYTATSSTNIDFTPWNFNFTPKYSDSKVLVIVNAGVQLVCDGNIYLKRDGTIIKDSWFGASRTDNQYDYPQATGFYLDSPATTSSVNYKVGGRASGCGNVIGFGGSDNHASITFMEIAQ